jgi:hypothetical protein
MITLGSVFAPASPRFGFTALLLVAAGCGFGQRADPAFDTRVDHPAYAKERPIVLHDDGHRTPHTSKGRYRPFVELLRHDGYEVRSHRGAITSRSLAGVRVLVEVNAQGEESDRGYGAAFTEAECRAIEEWVRRGGSLLLIADHAPLGLYAASLAARFGVEMSGGTTGDSIHMDPSGHDETQFLFSREDHTLGGHPIFEGRGADERVERVRTYTGQSLRAPEGAVPLLLLHATAVDYYLPTGDALKKARRSGRIVLDGPFPAKGSCQGLALNHGLGRVVVLGEAAALTAQREGRSRWGMGEPGADNRQFALNVMHWLSRLIG